MPVTLTEPRVLTANGWPPHKLWTREECEVLEERGLIDPSRYELVEGELIVKMGKNHRHIVAVALFCEWLRTVFGARLVLQEPSVDIAAPDNETSEPEPDAVMLARPFSDLTSRPRPGDIRLIVEVSDSTIAFDLTTKAALYARAAIQEYWVLDINGRRLITHRHPAEGRYQTVTAYSEDESVSPLAAPNASVCAKSLL